MDPSPLVFFLKVLNVEDKYEHKKFTNLQILRFLSFSKYGYLIPNLNVRQLKNKAYLPLYVLN